SHRSRVPGAQEKSQQVAPAVKTPPQDTTTDSELEEPRLPECKADADPPKLKCELCGRVDLENKFKRSKRFCSMACAKRYNVGFTKRVGLFQTDHSKRRRPRKSRPANPTADATKQITRLATPSSPGPPPAGSALKQPKSRESSRCSDNSSYEDLQSPPSASSSPTRQDLDMRGVYPGDPLKVEHNFLPSDPAHWKVDDVYEFIRSLPGCRDISEEFRAQEIDGQALLLLKEEHLMNAMNIKLGPALKIYARISMLKDS
ncbi:polyhomeotic-like protein 2, partial [Gastrophryne carolinensis]